MMHTIQTMRILTDKLQLVVRSDLFLTEVALFLAEVALFLAELALFLVVGHLWVKPAGSLNLFLVEAALFLVKAVLFSMHTIPTMRILTDKLQLVMFSICG